MKTLMFILSVLICSCTTPSKFFDSKYNYQQTITNNTRTDKKYSGINNLYQLSVTHLNQKTMSLKNQKLAFMQQWPSHKIEEASQKQEEDLSKTTQFLVLFYTPASKANNLSKGENSIWRTYLQIDNQRFQGIATSEEMSYSQLQTLFPNTSRFTRAYKVEFPISSSETDQASSISFILTSDIGTSELKFK